MNQSTMKLRVNNTKSDDTTAHHLIYQMIYPHHTAHPDLDSSYMISCTRAIYIELGND